MAFTPMLSTGLSKVALSPTTLVTVDTVPVRVSPRTRVTLKVSAGFGLASR